MFTRAFLDIDAFLTLPRLEGLWLAPGGERLVTCVGTAEGNQFVKALWEVDPAGKRPARRLTRSAEGESFAGFTPDGELLFTSKRPGSDGRAALWLQPREGGDARMLANPPGGLDGVVVAPDGTLVASSATAMSAIDPESAERLHEEREKAEVVATLHEDFPIRYWNHALGPEWPRLYQAKLTEEPLVLEDLTGHVGHALSDVSTWDLAPDSRTVVAVWWVPEPGASWRSSLVAIDVATGRRRTLLDDPALEYDAPQISPDGSQVAFGVQIRATQDSPGDRFVGLVDLDGGELRLLAPDWDRWPYSPRWTPDGRALVLTADDHGRGPLWRVGTETGDVTRLTPDDCTYTDHRVSPDGRWVYALRAAVDQPPSPVRIALEDTEAEPLPSPVDTFEVPGRLTEVTTIAADGTPLRGWLALPETGEPAPLVVQIHGGPQMSSKSWHWRWNPWPLVARGYAVLLPDYALSSGYGKAFMERGWQKDGKAPYEDVMALTDAAQERPDIDAERAAATGASWGGYLVNWIAGHTDRFAALVSHASIWNLDRGVYPADVAYYFERVASPLEYSPERYAEAITTPMLVTHGEKDYRVPIGHAFRLWWDLSTRAPGPHKLLVFPDEGHFVTKPNNLKAYYETRLNFLDHHVLGKDWQRPGRLG